MFSGYQVLQKCSYNQVASIWVDRARQSLEDGMFRLYMTCEVFSEM